MKDWWPDLCRAGELDAEKGLQFFDLCVKIRERDAILDHHHHCKAGQVPGQGHND